MNNRKILLVMLPFLGKSTPPLGISCLKSYLASFGFEVELFDFNQIRSLWKMCYSYLEALVEILSHQGWVTETNLLLDQLYLPHLTAHINKGDEKKYREFLKIHFKNYLIEIKEEQIDELESIVEEFYRELGKRVVEVVSRKNPSVVGVSLFLSTIPASLFALRLIKEKFPSVLTVAGGNAFADLLTLGSGNLKRVVERCDYIDKIIVGEGELLFLKFLKGEFDSSQKVISPKDIDNKMLNLSTAPPPDFDDFDLNRYLKLGIYGSRGCPHQCSFCSETVQWGKFRAKSAEQIVDEMILQNQKYKGGAFAFSDSLLNPVIHGLSSELIHRKVNFKWDAFMRIDKSTADIKEASLWKKAGMSGAWIGTESMSPNVLELMHKGISPELIRNSLRNLAGVGIKTVTLWVIGHPGETEEDFQKTLRFLTDSKEDIYATGTSIYCYYPEGQPGSAYFKKRFGFESLYPEEFQDSVLLNYYKLSEVRPTMKEACERFVILGQHARNLGITGQPPSFWEAMMADKRWEELHGF